MKRCSFASDKNNCLVLVSSETVKMLSNMKAFYTHKYHRSGPNLIIVWPALNQYYIIIKTWWFTVVSLMRALGVQ